MAIYYQIIVRYSPRDLWSPEFGDYDLTAVEFELETYRDSGDYAAARIIMVDDDSQVALAAAVLDENLLTASPFPHINAAVETENLTRIDSAINAAMAADDSEIQSDIASALAADDSREMTRGRTASEQRVARSRHGMRIETRELENRPWDKTAADMVRPDSREYRVTPDGRAQKLVNRGGFGVWEDCYELPQKPAARNPLEELNRLRNRLSVGAILESKNNTNFKR